MLLSPIALLENEEVIFRTKKHWILFFKPAVFLLLALFFAIPNTISNGVNQGFNLILQHTPYLYLAPKIPMLFLLILFLITAANQWLNYSTSDFVITNKRIIMRHGFFNRYMRDMRLATITLVSVQQDALGQLVDYGTLVIQSMGASDYFEKIAQPKRFQFYVQQEIDRNSRS